MYGGDNTNNRQRKFGSEYLKTGNATHAAVAAGYSPRSAATTGGRLLRNADVRTFMAAQVERLEAQEIADTREVMAFLTATMRGEVLDQFGLDASLSDRLTAARELLKRLDVTDNQRGTMDRLDFLLDAFRRAVNGENTPE